MSDTRITRDNDLRLQKFRCKYDMRKFYFINRVVDHWNIVCLIGLYLLTIILRLK